MNKIKHKNDIHNLRPYWQVFIPLAIFLFAMAFYPIRTLDHWWANGCLYLILLAIIMRTLIRVVRKYRIKAYRLIMLMTVCILLTIVQLDWLVFYKPLSMPSNTNPICPKQNEVEPAYATYATWDTGFSCLFSVQTPQYAMLERYIGWRNFAIRTGETAKWWG